MGVVASKQYLLFDPPPSNGALFSLVQSSYESGGRTLIHTFILASELER